MPELFNERDLTDAVDELATLPFFPHESRGAVMIMLRRMCPHRAALRWLTGQVVNHVDQWPGIAELRGILCSRYDPADGIDQWSSLPGYRAEDAEMRHIEEREQRLLEARQGELASESKAFIRQLAAGMGGNGG